MNKLNQLLLLILFYSSLTSSAIATPKPPLFNSDNALVKPGNYREWIYIGTALTPNDLNEGKANFPEFHNIYMNPQAWQAWKSKGQFVDGTMIVKELLSVGDHHAISGKGYFQGDFSVVAVAVKDKKRFAKEPGNWGYFVFDKTASTALPSATDACASCHLAHAKTDLVFTQYYPILRDSFINETQTSAR